MAYQILLGDVLERLRELPDCSVQCCVTSPPYWGLRDYGVDGQIGLEASPDEHVAKLVEVFREVRRVLRDDGVLWCNYGDAYAADQKGTPGLKPKDLIGLPWMLAFALRADGWWLRSDIIWAKPNPMPESVTDRPTRAHEYVFLLSKAARYYYDADAIREQFADERMGNPGQYKAGLATCETPNGVHGKGVTGNGWSRGAELGGRNARTVWTINPQPTPEAHFATFPEALAERCVKAGSKRGDIVLDPFAGSGTTLLVAERLGRDSIGIELNPAYVEIAKQRISRVDPMAPLTLPNGKVQPSLFAP